MKNCLIVANTSKGESKQVASQISEFLFKRNIETSIFYFDGFSKENPFVKKDFVITLGGDGTVLFAARGCAPLGIPVFPVNFGEFGFIASIQKTDWESELNKFLDNKAAIAERSMVQASIIRSSNKGGNYTGIGLNDVVICAKTAARTIMFNVAYNLASLGEYKADGIIVSTATGSTAYSSSAGGPIIDPELDALVLTPINPFSLSSRPLVLSPKGEIEITILPSRQHDVIITIDGQEPQDVFEGDRIFIRRIAQKVKLVGCTEQRFYEALQSKLNWSGGPHA